jgi:hypothetical protein
MAVFFLGAITVSIEDFALKGSGSECGNMM